MARKNLKIRVDAEGRLEIVDPGYDTLALICSIDPGFKIKTAPLPFFTSPRFLKVREMGCGLSFEGLENTGEGDLWDLHDHLLDRLMTEAKARQTDEASFLNLKIELAYRVLKSCRLCGRRCGVDRTMGKTGVCGLGMEATVSEHFVHIAEEPPVNPALNIVLSGCGLQCRFCQQEHLLDPSSVVGDPLKRPLWKRLNNKSARTLSFIGGNPDESLYAILRFLSDAPTQWALPVIWNCNGYATIETLRLLNGLIDAYIPDYKFGNPVCGDNLAGAPGYSDTAVAAIEAMLGQGVPVIVRILVLPGHVDCCHIPILERLKDMDKSGCLIISIRHQYCSEGIIKEINGHPMNKRATADEACRVRECAQNLHFNLVA
jgi:putative pyruvate formate lyase activating enzyme